MNWLISSANKILKLEDDVAMLAAIAKAAAVIERGDLVAGSDEIQTLLRELAQGPSERRNAIIEAIASPLLQGNAIAEAFERYVRVVGSIAPPAEYRLLFCRLGAMDSASCQGLDNRIQWRVIDREPATSRQVFSDLKLDIGAQVRQGFSLSIDPELPAELGPVLQGHSFRVGMEGNLEGSVAGNMPIRLGSINGGLSATGALRLDFYCLRHGNPLVAKAFSQFLENAPSPYQLRAVSRELDARRLHGIRLRATGSAQLSGAIKVGESLDVIRGLPSGIEGGVDFSIAETGGFDLIVRSADPTAGRGAPVQVQIRRSRNQTTSMGLGLRVGVDFTSLYQTLKPHLEKDLVGLDRLLDQIHAMMPPSRVVEDVLADRVRQWFKDDAARVLIDRLLGQSGSDDLSHILKGQLGQLMDTFDGLWVDQVETAALDLVGRLVNQPTSNLDAGSRALAMELLQPGLVAVLTSLRTQLREHLVETVSKTTSEGAFDRLSQDLLKVGQRIDNTAASASERLDALSRGLGLALQGYQNSLTRLSEALASTEEAKLGIQFRAHTRRRRGQALDLQLDLDPHHEDAPTVYQQVLTGSLESAFEHARSGSGAVLNVTGELAAIAGVQKHSRLDIAFLGIKLTSERLFTGDLAVTTDHNGNLAVHGRGESAAGIGVLGEKRRISAINVFDLAIAPQTRRLSLGLTLSQRNERLDDDDVTQFFDSLAADRIDLLPDALGAEGVQRLRALRDQDADHVVGGELRVWMELGESELLRLLSIRDVSAGLVGNPIDREQVGFIAVDAIVDAMQASGGKPARELREMELLVDEYGLAGDIRELLRKMVRRQTSMPGDISDGSIEGVRFRRMQRMADRASGFADLIQTLREIYFSAEKVQSGAWDKDDYLSRQEEIDKTLQFWFTAEPEDTFDLFGRLSRLFRSETEREPETLGLLNQKVRPYTLALLRTIKLLTATRIGTDDGAPLLASMTFNLDGTDKTVALV